LIPHASEKTSFTIRITEATILRTHQRLPQLPTVHHLSDELEISIMIVLSVYDVIRSLSPFLFVHAVLFQRLLVSLDNVVCTKVMYFNFYKWLKLSFKYLVLIEYLSSTHHLALEGSFQTRLQQPSYRESVVPGAPDDRLAKLYLV